MELESYDVYILLAPWFNTYYNTGQLDFVPIACYMYLLIHKMS